MSRRLSIEEINKRKPLNSRLTALYFWGYKIYNGTRYECVMAVCACGKRFKIVGTNISNGRAKSCGCWNIEQVRRPNKKYSVPTCKEYAGLYGSFNSMMDRCYKRRCIMYRFYGKRGVRVCKEWKGNYENFSKWALANGWKKGLHLDKDKLGDGKLYSPATCCWLTPQENIAIQHAKRRNKLLTNKN